MSKQTFLKGTFILILSGFVTKILGFINRIVLARMLGEEGVGLYMMAFPTFVLAVTLTQLGLPVAIAKLIAEAKVVNDKQKIKKILAVSLWTTSILGIIFTTCLFFIAPSLSKTLLTDSRTLYPILAISPVIPIIAIAAVIRGYFQGIQDMKPSAVSQIIEEIVRIGLVAICTSFLLPYGIEYGASGAMISIVLGEFASLCYMMYVFKRKKEVKIRQGFFATVRESKGTFSELMYIALPTTGGRLIGSISYFFEPIVVAQSLAIAGVSATAATKQYGELTGYAIPLLLLPNFITFALSTSLVPAISEAVAKKQKRLIEFRFQQATRLMLLVGGWSVVIMYVFASPALQLMYGTDNAAAYIHIMAPCFLLYYFQAPLQSILQAINMSSVAMINSLVGNIIKIICIILLASQPQLQTMGVALAVCAGMLTTTFLHYGTLLKKIHFTIFVKEYIFTAIAIFISIFVGSYLFSHITFSASLLYQTSICIAITTMLYLSLTILLGIIRKSEIKKLLNRTKM